MNYKTGFIWLSNLNKHYKLKQPKMLQKLKRAYYLTNYDKTLTKTKELMGKTPTDPN